MGVKGSGGGPNIPGRPEQKKIQLKRHPSQIGGPGNRSAIKIGTSRGLLQYAPPSILEDFNRRAAEVEFAKESKKWSGNLDGAHKKYGHLIDRKRLQAIYDNPKEYIKQLGIGAHSAIKNQQDLASMKGFEKYIRKTLDEASVKTKRLNRYLFPGGHSRSNIVRSIHFGHGQGLMAAGPNVGGSHTGQYPLDNMKQSKWSGPSKGAMGADGWYKVDDAYSAINHPQFWDEAWSNYILGEDMPILVDLTDEAKNKVLHRGYNPDRIIIEQDNIKLNELPDITDEQRKAQKLWRTRSEIDPKTGLRPGNENQIMKVTPGVEKAYDVKRGRRLARNLALGSLTTVGGLGLLGSAAGAEERLKIAKQTGKWTDWTAFGLESASGVGDLLGPGGEVISTPADVALLAMDAPGMLEDLAYKPPTVRAHEAALKQEQKNAAYNNTGTAMVAARPTAGLEARAATRKQQIERQKQLEIEGEAQEAEWRRTGQAYVTRTKNPLERLRDDAINFWTNLTDRD